MCAKAFPLFRSVGCGREQGIRGNFSSVYDLFDFPLRCRLLLTWLAAAIHTRAIAP
jgi:hypothetical protein